MCGFDPPSSQSQPEGRSPALGPVPLTMETMGEPEERSLLVEVKSLLAEIVAQQRHQGELLDKLQMQMDASQHRQRWSSARSRREPTNCQGQWRDFHGQQSKPTTVLYSPSPLKQEDPTPVETTQPTPSIVDLKSAQQEDPVVSRVRELNDASRVI